MAGLYSKDAYGTINSASHGYGATEVSGCNWTDMELCPVTHTPQRGTMADNNSRAEDVPVRTESQNIQPKESSDLIQSSQGGNVPMPSETEALSLLHESTESIPATNAIDPIDGSISPVKSGALSDDVIQVGKLSRLLAILHQRRGLILVIAGALFFSLADVLMDLLAEDMNVFQVSCITSIFAILLSATIVGIRRLARPRGKYQWLSLLFSGIIAAIGLPAAMLSLTYMSVGESIAVIFTMPIFVAIFGCIFLKESLKAFHVLFVILSFGGVILIAQPEFIFGGDVDQLEEETLLLGPLYGVATAVAFALIIVISRKQMTMGLNVFVLMLCNYAVTCIIGAILCTVMNGWSAPSGFSWLEMVGYTSLDFTAQIVILMALAVEAAVLVSLSITSEVIFAFIWQIFIFKEYPNWLTIVGSVLILISCSGAAMTSPNQPEQTDSEIDERENNDDDALSENPDEGV